MKWSVAECICGCYGKPRMHPRQSFPSKREGLGLASLEAMATGLPIIGSNVRGIVDYVINGKTGFLCEVNNATEYANAIARLYQDSKLRDMIKKENVEFVKNHLNLFYYLIFQVQATRHSAESL